MAQDRRFRTGVGAITFPLEGWQIILGSLQQCPEEISSRKSLSGRLEGLSDSRNGFLNSDWFTHSFLNPFHIRPMKSRHGQVRQ